jgi:tetratricopeptide (TPR) repeat protein
MSKFFLFYILLYLTRSPIVAILVLLVILYLADRRFIGLLPNLLEPFRQSRKRKQLRQDLRMNPHNTQAKLELARILLQKKHYAEADAQLEEVRRVMPDSADVLYESGFAQLKLGRVESGAARIREALAINPRVRYGEPYLRLAEALSATDRDQALRDLEAFQELNSSSCEAYYRLGLLNQQLGRTAEAKQAFRAAVDVYRALPKYLKRSERRWALLSWFKK